MWTSTEGDGKTKATTEKGPYKAYLVDESVPTNEKVSIVS
ncbi:hypothetical protein TELCIR_21702 [Teladorsagia circumcincta]|uniref:Uncharacterized protein n=1 Tax=Teladorsagia circumcincta TaxID=45464 RepID=A0A2G9TG14_TELCI|nr:hypothetical protein TELCIR_21702 [Teladorsagia circumcincta]